MLAFKADKGGPEIRAAVASLGTALEDSDSQVRKDAAFALLMIGPEAEDAVSRLIAALQDESAEVRQYAVGALKDIGPSARRALPNLRLALGDPAIQVRTAAAAEKRERVIEAAARSLREDASIASFSLDAVAKAVRDG